MTEINLRDLPSRDRLAVYQKEFPELEIENILLYLNFQQTSRDLAKDYATFIAPFELTEAKFTLMMLLDREQTKSLTPLQLAKKAGVKKATITGLLIGLEKAGFIIRKENPQDKRSTQIVLSKAGNTKLETFLPYNYQKANSIMSTFTKEEKETLQSLLTKLKDGIQNE